MYIKALEDARRGAEKISHHVGVLRKAEMFLTEEEKEIRNAIERVITRDGEATEYLIEGVIAAVLGDIDMGQILANNISHAVATNPEFAKGMLLSPLIGAARSSRNFTFMVNRSRWGSTVDIIIDMDSTAGSLDEYASGVKKVREQLEAEAAMAKAMRPRHWKQSKPKPRDPIKASKYWKERVYLNVNQMWYNSTMEQRIEESGKLAPYWKLLDRGSISMQSDWGGIPYPQGTSSDFTGKTISDIKREFKYGMSSAEDRFRHFSSIVMDMYKEIDNARIRIGHRTREMESTDITIVDKLIAKYGDDLDVDKLRSTLDAISRGENPKTTAEGRIEMTARGRSGGARPRPTLRSLIEGMR